MTLTSSQRAAHEIIRAIRGARRAGSEVSLRDDSAEIVTSHAVGPMPTEPRFRGVWQELTLAVRDELTGRAVLPELPMDDPADPFGA